MTDETPYSALLRRAAARIREVRDDATPGPWTWSTWRCSAVDGGPHHVNCPGVDELVHEQEPMGGWGDSPLNWPVHPANVLKVPHSSWPPSAGDAAWIAMMSPAIAIELAALFDAAALDDEQHNASGAMTSAFTDYAVILAGLVLGEKR